MSSRPDNCSQCTIPCSVFYTQVIEGKANKVGMCDGCPKAKALDSDCFEAMDSLCTAFKSKPEMPLQMTATAPVCPACGLTAIDFKESGRLGCSKCYETFEAKLEPVLKDLHKGTAHVGKRPSRFAEAFDPIELDYLKKRLEELVAREEYEEAAKIRDRILEMEEREG